MDIQELLRCYASGERVFAGIKISGSIRDADLKNINLSGACLEVEFEKCDLRNANLSNIQVDHTSFFDCNLSKADLTNAELFQSSFREANLHNAN